MPRVVHFEINADKPERAAAFYKKVFGWKVKKWGDTMPYWLVTTGKKGEMGINGGIMNRMKKETTVNTVGVKSLDQYLKKVVKAGGKQATPKNAIPGYGWFAYCKDSEGNLFGLMQPDMKAK